MYLYMISYINVYLFPDSINNLRKDNLINKIEKDTHTTIKITDKKYDPFISIEGQFEDVHKVRIILQELEKNSYREAYIKKKWS